MGCNYVLSGIIDINSVIQVAWHLSCGLTPVGNSAPRSRSLTPSRVGWGGAWRKRRAKLVGWHKDSKGRKSNHTRIHKPSDAQCNCWPPTERRPTCPRAATCPPQPPPQFIPRARWRLVAWTIPLARGGQRSQPGSLPALRAPPCPTEPGKLEKSLTSYKHHPATTKTSVCYQQHADTKSKTQHYTSYQEEN